MLPSWLDTNTLQWLILAVIAVLVVSMLVIVRFIQKLVMKTALIAVVVGLGLSLWVQRANLDDCLLTCECSLYGKEVRVTYDQLPQVVRDRIAAGDTKVCPDIAVSG